MLRPIFTPARLFTKSERDQRPSKVSLSFSIWNGSALFRLLLPGSAENFNFSKASIWNTPVLSLPNQLN